MRRIHFEQDRVKKLLRFNLILKSLHRIEIFVRRFQNFQYGPLSELFRTEKYTALRKRII